MGSEFGPMYDRIRAAYGQAGRCSEVHCDLLYQCDLDCQHCYLDDKNSRNHPTSFWRGVFDQLAEMEVFQILISGGELFVRPDAFELIEYARGLGLCVHIFTHGGRLDGKGARRLADLGVASVQLSIYSHRPEVHDAITRRPGSHQRTWATLEALVGHGVLVKVACVVMEQNRDDVPEFSRRCDDLGVQLTVDGMVRSALSGAAMTRDRALGLEDATAFEGLKIAQRGDIGAPCALPGVSDGWDDRTMCGAGHGSLYINPEGKVTPCHTWPELVGDLAGGDRLADLWAQSPVLHRIRGLRNRDRAVCGSCSVKAHCFYCPGQAHIESRDALSPPEAVCLDGWAKGRAWAKATDQVMPAQPPGLAGPKFHILTGGASVGCGPAA